MMPRYTGYAVITVDGKIAKNHTHFVDWSSAEDKRFLRAKLDASDAVVIGRKTFDTLRARVGKISRSRRYIVITRRVKEIKKKNNVLYCNADAVDIDSVIRQNGYRRIAVLGGAEVYKAMINLGLLREFYVTVEPIVFGKGVPMLSGSIKNRSWKLVSVRRLNRAGTLLLRYSI